MQNPTLFAENRKEKGERPVTDSVERDERTMHVGCVSDLVQIHANGVRGVCAPQPDACQGTPKINLVARAKREQECAQTNVSGVIGESVALDLVRQETQRHVIVASVDSKHEPVRLSVDGVTGALVKESGYVHQVMSLMSNVV